MIRTHEQDALVIGAGFAGIAAATRLATLGHSVTVLERHDQPGGRARTFEDSGFVFDMGPSWYWMPDVFEEFFTMAGTTVEQHLDLVRFLAEAGRKYRVGMDRFVRRYDRKDFDTYIVGSAEVVGLMCLKVFVRGDHALYDRLEPSAVRLGAAFQKVNFLALPRDARLGVFLAHSYYRQLLRRIRCVPSRQVMEARIRVPDVHKAALLASAWTRHRLNLV